MIKKFLKLIKNKIINPIKEELDRWEFAEHSHDRLEKVKADYNSWIKEYRKSIGKSKGTE